MAYDKNVDVFSSTWFALAYTNATARGLPHSKAMELAEEAAAKHRRYYSDGYDSVGHRQVEDGSGPAEGGKED